jgi:hypothetical protein
MLNLDMSLDDMVKQNRAKAAAEKKAAATEKVEPE